MTVTGRKSLNVKSDFPVVGPHVVAVNNYNWLGDNIYFNYRWNNGYAAITRSNYVLSKIDEIDEETISDEARKAFKGEALFLRALFYFDMVIGFGDIPLVLDVLSAEEANTVSKAPESEIWSQIVSDLISATTLLPESYGAADLGRATKKAAYALLSRVYLWTNEWQKSIDAANAVSGCSLVDAEAYIGIFDGSNEFSAESIFECIHIQNFGALWNDSKTEQSYLMNIGPRTSWGDYFHPRKEGNYDILKYYEEGDMRRKASFYIPYVDSVTYNGVMGIFPDTDKYTDWRPNLVNGEVYQMRKFLPSGAENWQSNGANNQKFKVNHPIIRYAEVLLNKAEALIEKDKLGDARAIISQLRSRAGLTDLVDGSIPDLELINGFVDIDDMNKEQLRELVRHERRLELFFEGHRWFDLKRWGILEDVLTDAGFANFDPSKHMYWPIPSSELEINPNLAK